MERNLLKDYLVKSGMDVEQAEALSRVLDDMEARLATKADLRELRFEVKAQISGLESRLDTRLFSLKSELKDEMATLRVEANATKAELTLRMIAVVGFFATAMTLLNAFLG